MLKTFLSVREVTGDAASAVAHGLYGAGYCELDYVFHDLAITITITITQCGRICLGARKIHLSTVSAGPYVGVKQVADRVWIVTFTDYELGFFDHETGRIECAENLFGPKVFRRSSV